MRLAAGQEMPGLIQGVTREQIKAYAEASGDQNPIHQDDAVAVAVGLPGVIAHGMLSYALLTRAVVDWIEDPGGLRSLKVRFSTMVRPGDTVTCRGRVAAIDEVAGTATLTVWVENQRGERVLNHGEAVVSI
ncbi:MAG: MaoC/PaaZ C-terminal domain-containing protein [Candidatus Dormibacteria bacterium]